MLRRNTKNLSKIIKLTVTIVFENIYAFNDCLIIAIMLKVMYTRKNVAKNI